MARPQRAPSTCARAACDAETLSTYCPAHTFHKAPAKRAVDPRAAERAKPYGRKWREGPRKACLQRDPVCTVCGLAPSTVADHHPLERAELLELGVEDCDALAYLRGVCASCHSRKSARGRFKRW